MGLVALQHVGSSWTRDLTHVSCIERQILYHWATREAQMLCFKPTFLLFHLLQEILFFFFICSQFCHTLKWKGLGFISSSLSAIRVVSSAYLKLLIFLLAIFIPIWFIQPCISHDVLAAWMILCVWGVKVALGVWLFETSWTLQSMEFSRPEYWSGQPFPSPGDLPNPGTEPRSPVLQEDSLLSEPPGKPKKVSSNKIQMHVKYSSTNLFKEYNLLCFSGCSMSNTSRLYIVTMLI